MPYLWDVHDLEKMRHVCLRGLSREAEARGGIIFHVIVVVRCLEFLDADVSVKIRRSCF